MSDPLPSLHHSDTPEIARDEMAEVRERLDETVPPKRAAHRNLLIATWNIKNFGSLTEKWLAGGSDSPKRDWRALWAIAKIISRFDVVAIQEVTGDLKALRTLLKTLGPGWAFLMTDVVRGKEGAAERLAFVFDRGRVEPSGLAAELVVPQEWLDEIDEGALKKQFARTPYAVSFRAGAETFILVTLHVLYGSGAADRLPELKAIARWMHEWARQTNRWHHNLIALGDFNIEHESTDQVSFSNIKWPIVWHSHHGWDDNWQFYRQSTGHNAYGGKFPTVQPNVCGDRVPVPPSVAQARVETAVTIDKIADGTYLLGGGPANSYMVEFRDFVAVFEAPGNEERSLAVIEAVTISRRCCLRTASW